MANDPNIGYKMTATVMKVKGDCSAGHKAGEVFQISCFDSGGLCGFFYHDVFPSLQTFQFGGSLPWWEGDIITLECPDKGNQVILQVERTRNNEA